MLSGMFWHAYVFSRDVIALGLTRMSTMFPCQHFPVLLRSFACTMYIHVAEIYPCQNVHGGKMYKRYLCQNDNCAKLLVKMLVAKISSSPLAFSSIFVSTSSVLHSPIVCRGLSWVLLLNKTDLLQVQRYSSLENA